MYIYICVYIYIYIYIYIKEGIATSNNPMPALNNPAYFARAANRYREKKFPDEPADLSFQLKTTYHITSSKQMSKLMTR